MNPLLLIMPRIPEQYYHRYGNINPLSIAYATRLGLGPTNPGTIIVAQETLLFRWAGFSPALWLLIPAFSLDNAPPDLTVSTSMQISTLLYHAMPTNPHNIHIFGTMLSPVTFSAQDLLTSELLRTL